MYHKLKSHLKGIADFSFEKQRPGFLMLASVVVLFLILLQTFFDIFLADNIFGHNKANLSDLSQISSLDDGSVGGFISKNFSLLWIAAALFTLCLRGYVIIWGYFEGVNKFGKKRFQKNILTFFSAGILAMISRIFIVGTIGLVSALLGWHLSKEGNVISEFIHSLEQLVLVYVPTIFKFENYFLALLVSILSLSLPGYFMHKLSHDSRFFWLTMHRPHHTPNILHPAGVTPGFVFELLALIPMTLFSASVSKLFYAEPMIMEISLWLILEYGIEIFNHSAVHYEFTLKNPIIRNLCRLFGAKGAYHIMHHSSLPGDERINFGEGPLLLWDRLFGTYRTPAESMPPVGLCSKEEVRLSPIRVLFSGWMQLAYELRYNPNWKTRFKILFGNSFYKPAVTKDYLVVSEKDAIPFTEQSNTDDWLVAS